MSKRHKTYTRLDALYATLPRLSCQGLCFQSCGPISLTQAEAERLTRAETARVAEPGAPHIPQPFFNQERLACSLLDKDNHCSQYAIRPAVCRLFGISKDAPCPFGCIPDRWLSHEQTETFLARVAKATGNQASIYTGDPELLACALALEAIQTGAYDESENPEIQELVAIVKEQRVGTPK